MIDNGEDLAELIEMGLGEYIQDYFEQQRLNFQSRPD